MVVTLTPEHALVLYAWLARARPEGQPAPLEDQAEQQALWDLQQILESVLTEPLEDNYEYLVAAARAALRDDKQRDTLAVLVVSSPKLDAWAMLSRPQVPMGCYFDALRELQSSTLVRQHSSEPRAANSRVPGSVVNRKVPTGAGSFVEYPQTEDHMHRR